VRDNQDFFLLSQLKLNEKFVTGGNQKIIPVQDKIIYLSQVDSTFLIQEFDIEFPAQIYLVKTFQQYAQYPIKEVNIHPAGPNSNLFYIISEEKVMLFQIGSNAHSGLLRVIADANLAASEKRIFAAGGDVAHYFITIGSRGVQIRSIEPALELSILAEIKNQEILFQSCNVDVTSSNDKLSFQITIQNSFLQIQKNQEYIDSEEAKKQLQFEKSVKVRPIDIPSPEHFFDG